MYKEVKRFYLAILKGRPRKIIMARTSSVRVAEQTIEGYLLLLFDDATCMAIPQFRRRNGIQIPFVDREKEQWIIG